MEKRYPMGGAFMMDTVVMARRKTYQHTRNLLELSLVFCLGLGAWHLFVSSVSPGACLPLEIAATLRCARAPMNLISRLDSIISIISITDHENDGLNFNLEIIKEISYPVTSNMRPSSPSFIAPLGAFFGKAQSPDVVIASTH